MTLMKALKTFRVGSTQQVVTPGQEFETTNAREYEVRGMAVPVATLQKPRKPNENAATNKAAQSGPLASPGGKTGATTSQSLSPQGQAHKTPRSGKSEDRLV